MLKARGHESGRMLLVASAGHLLAEEARLAGYEVVIHIAIDEVEQGAALPQGCNLAVVYHQLEKARDVSEAIRRIQMALCIGGVLFVATPSVQSWPHDFLGSHWTEWRPENLRYFSPVTLQGLLLRHGFREVLVEPDRRRYSLRHIHQRAQTSPRSLLTSFIIFLFRLTPPPLRNVHLRFSCSSILATCVREEKRSRPLCSIVVPAYNEKVTVRTLLDQLCSKTIQGMDKEIIIVESNSTDGTRAIVLGYEQTPGVRIVLEDKPRGKGHAVRKGLQVATGDVVIIQDADLEYDLNDYDELIEPLRHFRAAFVLGSRHGGSWKMRHFKDNWFAATILNFGHLFFTGLINTLYRQRMRDPFTMFKVFWRDCLYGLTFECNRFDFDCELVIKLVRKGYRPLEIPVNYESRSFKEGKKVQFFRDPLTWIWAMLKYRVVPLRQKQNAPQSPLD